MSQDAETKSKSAACQNCGAPIDVADGYPDIRDKCYSERGSCCAEQDDSL